jgi:hypothetical protein
VVSVGVGTRWVEEGGGGLRGMAGVVR